VRFASDWTCEEEESFSDHNIVNFKIASINKLKGKMNYTEVRYRANQQDYKTFDTILASNFIATFNCSNKTDANKLDEELQEKNKPIKHRRFNRGLFIMCNSSM